MPTLLQPGDILALRADRLPPQPWWVTLAEEAIAVGERLFDRAPRYIHIALAVAPEPDNTCQAIEELANGCDLTTEPLDARWDIIRVYWRDEADPQRLIAFCRAKLGTPYNYLGLPTLGIDRLLHLRGQDNQATMICSALIAEGLHAIGYDCWPTISPSNVAPSDYPGVGMEIVTEAQGVSA